MRSVRRGVLSILLASFSCARRAASAPSALRLWAAVAGLVLAGMAQGAHAAGDAKAGAVLFNRCSICHSNTKGGPNKLGPNLFGVVGRKAGTYPGYSYSPELKGSGITWTPDKLTAWLAGPQKLVRRTNMVIAPISDPKQRTDIVAYLSTLK